jgi:uncharacterized phage-associated protein
MPLTNHEADRSITHSGDTPRYKKVKPAPEYAIQESSSAQGFSGEATEPKWVQAGQFTIQPQPAQLSVFDVGAYIQRKLGSVSAMKLQKLAYYCQAWSLVWDEKPLFKENIEAWVNGPVIKELFNHCRGNFIVDKVLIGNPDLLDAQQRETVDAVLNFYGEKTAQWLIDLSHSERPWQQAREGLSENERSSRIISYESMAEYYSSLPDA